MLYVKMSCGCCGNAFEIYSREMNFRDTPVRCPHCLQQMDNKQWNNLIDAFLTAADWNGQGLKAHGEHGSPLFQAEFISKHVPQSKIIKNLEMEE